MMLKKEFAALIKIFNLFQSLSFGLKTAGTVNTICL